MGLSGGRRARDSEDGDEGQGQNRQVIIARIDFNKCEICDECDAAGSCAAGTVVRIDHDEPAAIDQALCHGCGDCVLACPHGAISIMEV